MESKRMARFRVGARSTEYGPGPVLSALQVGINARERFTG